MKWISTPLPSVWLLEPETVSDSRGLFTRLWCEREAAERGLSPRWVQQNLSLTVAAGTFRGLHYQLPPNAEAKLIRCSRGAIWDVAVDLRPDSPTRLQWYGTQLSAENRRALYVPEGCGHGFLSLSENSEVQYLVSAFYAPSCERGLRWDDPVLQLELPADVLHVSPKDNTWPRLQEQRS
jgi:dTDP-4-dehydrorhamnose 3,5-epimerase